MSIPKAEPEYPEGKKAPKWLRRVFEAGYLPRIERSMQLKILRMIDCGFWGCVFTTSDPRWVVKISSDPTEGPMQAEIGKRQQEGQYGYDGFAFVQSVARLSKKIKKQRKEVDVFVIVREEVEPLDGIFRAYSFSARPNTMVTEISPKARYADVKRAVKALGQYNTLAFDWYKAKRNAGQRDQELLWRQMEGQLSRVSKWFPHLGQSMGMFHYEGRPLKDVHYGNIGIRRHVMDGVLPGDAALGAVVCFDPGHTPSEGLNAPIFEIDLKRGNPAASASTSRKQVAALLRSAPLKRGTVNLDLGGGAYDEGTRYLRKKGVRNHVLDPFHRSRQENAQAARCRPHSVTCANVLNVCPSKAERMKVIRKAHRSLPSGGVAYFSTYEGDKSGVGRRTRDGYQLNRRTEAYVSEIQKVFANVERMGAMIVASKGRASNPRRPNVPPIGAGRRRRSRRRRGELDALVAALAAALQRGPVPVDDWDQDVVDAIQDSGIGWANFGTGMIVPVPKKNPSSNYPAWMSEAMRANEEKKQFRAKYANANTKQLAVEPTEGRGRWPARMIIHRSTKKGSKLPWRITFFGSDGKPTGHDETKTLDGAIQVATQVAWPLRVVRKANPIKKRRNARPIFRAVSPWEMEDILATGQVTGRGSWFSGDSKRTAGRVWFGESLEDVIYHGLGWSRYLESTPVFMQALRLKKRIYDSETALALPPGATQRDSLRWPERKKTLARQFRALRGWFQKTLYDKLWKALAKAKKSKKYSYVIEAHGVRGGTLYTGPDSMSGVEGASEIAVPKFPASKIERVFAVRRSDPPSVVKSYRRPEDGWAMSPLAGRKLSPSVLGALKDIAKLSRETESKTRLLEAVARSVRANERVSRRGRRR